MALIAFLVDNEEGHLLPSFDLAHAMEKNGHNIVYIAILDLGRSIKEQGFGFYPIFQDVYPYGFNERNKRLIREKGYEYVSSQKIHLDEITNDSFGAFVQDLRPDLFIVSSFLGVETLILYYRYGIRPVIFSPIFREPGSDRFSDCIGEIMKMPGDKALKLIEFLSRTGIQIRSLPELASPVKDFDELVLCPRELEIKPPPANEKIHYTAPSISLRKDQDEPFRLPGVPAHKKIIYASLGSQAQAYGNISDIFFRTMIKVMERGSMEDLHLILATGAGEEAKKISPMTANVTLMEWAPQARILREASAAVIHGGIGAVKECIYYGVPMVVIPIARDQPSNAMRVEHHRLGRTIRADEVSEDNLADAIHYVLENEAIRIGIARMRDIFLEQEKTNSGAEIIETLLKKNIRKTNGLLK